MKTLLSSFKLSLPKEIQSLIEILDAKEIKVGFVGGVVRDFILNDIISDDIDIEIRSEKKIDMIELCKELNGSLNEEFMIITLNYKDTSVEMGLPRIENFKKNNKSHKNFSFINSFGYYEEFLRRDFTINAIMFEYTSNQMTIIDPLNGINDLKLKILRPCSDDFYLDPVRKLRAYRFKINLDFNFSELVADNLKEMDINDCSSYYIVKEVSKTKRPLNFLLSIGLIDSFYEPTIYNSSIYSLSVIVQREPSISNKKSLLALLNLSQKAIFPFKHVDSFRQCYEMFKYILGHKVSSLEVNYLLKYAGLDVKNYNFKNIQSININFNSEGMTETLKEELFLNLLEKELEI